MGLSDGTTMTMPVAPTGMMGGNGWGGFGGDNGWWVILFLIIICGWGGYGNGFGNRGGNGAVDGYVLTSDFANIERKLDGVNNGICDGFYAMNTGMLNGFAGVTQAITSGFSAAELARCNQQSALMQTLFQMQMQAQNCCCENREAIQGVRYDMAAQACDTRNTVQNTTRDIIDAMNCGFRSIDQRLTAQELAAKDAKIAEQNQQLFAAQLAASQAAQNSYLVSTLRPSPNPAYVVANPYCCNSGYNYGCGNCA